MKFKIVTLVDLEETRARRGDSPILVNKHANFMTLYNTIGLRTNPTNFTSTSDIVDLKTLTFGSAFKGKQRVTTVYFNVEAADSLTYEMLINDFNLVPFISGLDETIKFKNNVFRTTDLVECNIIFQEE
jgi:hypothetical protein